MVLYHGNFDWKYFGAEVENADSHETIHTVDYLSFNDIMYTGGLTFLTKIQLLKFNFYRENQGNHRIYLKFTGNTI